MSEYYYYGMAAVMLLTTSWTFAAVRWFHTCRAPKREHRYIWPDRKLQVLVYLCSIVLVPYAVNPTSEAAWVLMKSYLVGTIPTATDPESPSGEWYTLDIVGNHQYQTVAGWTWERLIQDGKAALAVDTADTAQPRIVSTDKKALKAGGLQLAGVAVAPTDEADSAREYELVAIG